MRSTWLLVSAAWRARRDDEYVRPFVDFCTFVELMLASYTMCVFNTVTLYRILRYHDERSTIMIPEVLPTRPYNIAADTWLVPTLVPEGSGGYIGAHSLVIAGAEPVIVDTGASLVREHWMDQAFSIVDPADVRWVVLSHDDHDHIGNLLPVLDECPNATLVASFAIFQRLAGDVELPLERMRWVDVGESLDVGIAC